MTIIAIVEEAFFAAQQQNHRNQTDTDERGEEEKKTEEEVKGGDEEVTGLEVLSRSNSLNPSAHVLPSSRSPGGALSRGNSLNPAFALSVSSLPRSTSLRGEEGVGGGEGSGSSKRELPEKVKVLLRHVSINNSANTGNTPAGEERK